MSDDTPTLHVLPRWDDLAVCIVRGEKIEELLRFPVEPSRLSTRSNPVWSTPSLSQPRGTVLDPPAAVFTAPMSDGVTRLIRLDVSQATSQVVHESILDLPANFAPKCLRYDRGRLFAAGGSRDAQKEEGSQIGYFDWNADPVAWNNIDIPFPDWETRKEIDAVLIDGDRLIAVDNIVYPKYLVDCDISGKPVVTKLSQLENHGTYERIEQAALGGNWIAILSSTGSMGGPRWHLALLARKSLVERHAMHVVPTSFADYLAGSESPVQQNELRELARYYEFREWNDIAFCGDTLIVAAGKDGIAVLDLQKSPPIQSRLSRSRMSRADFATEYQKNLIYRTLGIPKAEALCVDAIDAGRVIVTYRVEERLESRVVRL